MSTNKSFIQLSSGEHHYFGESFAPDITSIAFSLCFINRFNGHIGSYSVAQHSILVAQQLPQELKLSGLLHDATESYLGDVASPLKTHLRSIGDTSYRETENKYHKIIDDYFGVDTLNPAIKEVDMRILVTEGKSFGVDGIVEFNNFEPYGFTIERKRPEIVYGEFMSLFYELGGKS